jgi:hypothetical protein
MIEATQKKLREARFFLAQLEHEQYNAGLNPSEAVEYYFSAFLSAARSVTFVLEAEEPDKYSEWSPARRNMRSEADKDLLGRFTTARNRALKRATPGVVEDQLTSGFVASDGNLPAELQFFFSEDSEGCLPAIGHRVIKVRLRPSDVEEDIAPLCRKYDTIVRDGPEFH